MKMNKITVLLIGALMIPGIALASPNTGCSKIPSAHSKAMSQLQFTRNFANTNVALNGTTGSNPVAAKNTLIYLDKVITKMKVLAKSADGAQYGAGPGSAYMINDQMKHIVRDIWTANHFAAQSFFWDKAVAAQSAMSEGLKANELLARFQTLSLKCYVHDVL